MQILAEDAVMTVHVGDVVVVDNGRFQKLELIGQNIAVEDVVTSDAVHIMAVTLGEECIDF